MRKSILFVIIAAVLLLTGCAPVTGGASPSLTDSVQSASPSQTDTVQSAAPESVEVPFAAQYIRTAWSEGEYPRTVVIRSVSELEDYYASNNDVYAQDVRNSAKGQYDDAYFGGNALILIVLGESSGSIRHNVKSVSTDGSGIAVSIERLLPEVGTDDMAEWHIFVEIEKKYAAGDVNIGLKVEESKAVPFAAQYIRPVYVANKKYPFTIIMRSSAELKEYHTTNKNVVDAMKRYDDAYFKDNALILILLREPSGSIRHNVSSVTSSGSVTNITIERLLPEEQTCDMAGWYIFVEIAKEKAKDNVTVTFADVNLG